MPKDAWESVSVDIEMRRILAPKAVISALLGANASWLSSLNLAPVEPGLYSLADVQARYVEYREGVSARRARAEAQETATAAETKLELQQARLVSIQLRNQKMAGELVDIESVQQALQSAMTTFKSRLLAVPGRMAAEGEIDASQGRALSKRINDALEELADAGIQEPSSLDPGSESL